MLLTWLAVVPALFVASIDSIAPQVTEYGFEDRELGSIPEPWIVPTHGWKAEVSAENASQGARSLKLSKPGGSTAPFGNVMQQIDGAEFAGQHVTLTAKMRVVGSGRGQMWLRVDCAGGEMGAFDNMDDRPILEGDWHDAQIEADIEPTAATLNIGFMSIGGSATVFIDDVKIALSAARTPVQAQSASGPFSERGARNVVAAAKLLSYVRFFHPSDQAVGVASWDHFAVDLMDRAEPASDAADLARRLHDAFEPIAPTIDIWPGTVEHAPPPRARPTEATKLAMWKHTGAGRLGSSSPYNIYRSEVIVTDSMPVGIDEQIVTDLGGGVCARVPIAIFRDDTGTLPHGETPTEWATKKDLPKLIASNRSTRLAGVALAWGVFQHFYPYFDVVVTDWNAALPTALSKAATDADASEYSTTLRMLVAQLHDGHGSVRNRTARPQPTLPIAAQWLGRELVVVGKADGISASLDIGDVIVSIGGRAIEDCYADAAKQISAATEGWCRYVSQHSMLRGDSTNDSVDVVVRKLDGTTTTVALSRTYDAVPVAARKPSNGAEVAPGVVYFDLDHADSQAVKDVLDKLTSADALVFDLRGYPGEGARDVLAMLAVEPLTSARWCVPIVHRPDHEHFDWDESGRWHLPPSNPHLAAPVAFLTDGRAISYAESIMGIVESYKLGEIVGATTAGTNGNVNPFELPGGFSVAWTGMKVLKHDGSQHHGVGIAPTVAVTPTARGIAAGCDEVLARAIEVLQAKLAPRELYGPPVASPRDPHQ